MAAGVDHYAIKRSDFMAPISLLRDVASSASLPLEECDVLHLHGINGTLSLKNLAELTAGRKTVWTLHDMNPFTSVCHYSLGCNGFTSGCRSCPAVRKGFTEAVGRHFEKKREAIRTIENLTVVSPSSWLAEQAIASGIFSNAPVLVQPNPINAAFFDESMASSAPKHGYALSVIAVAASLDDEVKNMSFLVDAFTEAFGNRTDVKLTLVGQGGASFSRANIERYGRATAGEIRDLVSQSDVLVVTSRAENAPLVIPEAAAQGCEAFVAAVGGMPELVTTLGGGAVFTDERTLVGLLATKAQEPAKKRDQVRKQLRAQARAIFHPLAVASEYAKVYS